MSRRIGVLVPYKEFERDIPHYGEAKASWIRFAIESFEKMPPRHHGEAIEASRMIAVIQGWDVTAEELAAQRAAAREAGALGLVIAFDQIEQGWTPVVRPWKSSNAR